MDEWIESDSAVMRTLGQTIDLVAMTDATVLIWGESGVGKELVSRRLHERSLRRNQAFIKVNCAALPLELLESELFGYERGAFTGAHRRKPGKFEVADKGTIMLDEIGEMPLSLQAKLLQVLQDREFSRLGSRHDIRVDVRVLAVTNRNLALLVEQGGFREDLYYRINVVSLPVPPLRERREEIPVLAERFRKRYCEQYGRALPPLAPETIKLFMTHRWKGNVRELDNLVKRTVVLGSEDWVAEELASSREPLLDRRTDDSRASNGVARALPTSSRGPLRPSTPSSLTDLRRLGEELGLKEIARRAARDAERTVLAAVLEHVHWNRVEAARRLKVSYAALLYKIKYHELARYEEGEPPDSAPVTSHSSA